jgi:hypothetical protein
MTFEELMQQQKRADFVVKKPSGYLSIIGFTLIEPLLTLLETLEAASPKPPNEVQTGPWENGYSVAIVVLAVVLLESALNMIRRHERSSGRMHVATYFAKICPDPELAEAIHEVFGVRDAIVHNHVWEAQIEWVRQQGMKFTAPPTLQEGYGDSRFKNIIEPTSRCSRRLGLNLFPPRIWRRDVHIVLKTVSRALTTLEAWKPAYLDMDIQMYEFQGQELTFPEIIAALPEEKS